MVTQEDMQSVEEMRQSSRIRDAKREGKGEEIFLHLEGRTIRALLYKSDMENAPVIFDIHGGGFVSGYPEEDVLFCNMARDRLNATVISIEYRKAPEHPYPQDKLDAYDAIAYIARHAQEFGIDIRQMVIGGHSAGGNIATVVCMMANERKEFSFCCQYLAYPALDLTSSDCRIEGVTPHKYASLFRKLYCEKTQQTEPYCSPVFAENRQICVMPGTVMLSCEKDTLRDQATTYGKRLSEVGVEVIYKRFIGAVHGFNVLEDSQMAIDGNEYLIDGIAHFLQKNIRRIQKENG